jgi:hypothetical protein
MASDFVFENYRPKKVDLLIAVVAALVIPVIAGYFFDLTGALIPMVMYYGLFAILIVRWRRGSLGYAIDRENMRMQF